LTPEDEIQGTEPVEVQPPEVQPPEEEESDPLAPPAKMLPTKPTESYFQDAQVLLAKVKQHLWNVNEMFPDPRYHLETKRLMALLSSEIESWGNSR
jgi:hypothetical protein